MVRIAECAQGARKHDGALARGMREKGLGFWLEKIKFPGEEIYRHDRKLVTFIEQFSAQTLF